MIIFSSACPLARSRLISIEAVSRVDRCKRLKGERGNIPNRGNLPVEVRRSFGFTVAVVVVVVVVVATLAFDWPKLSLARRSLMIARALLGCCVVILPTLALKFGLVVERINFPSSFSLVDGSSLSLPLNCCHAWELRDPNSVDRLEGLSCRLATLLLMLEVDIDAAGVVAVVVVAAAAAAAAEAEADADAPFAVGWDGKELDDDDDDTAIVWSDCVATTAALGAVRRLAPTAPNLIRRAPRRATSRPDELELAANCRLIGLFAVAFRLSCLPPAPARLERCPTLSSSSLWFWL